MREEVRRQRDTSTVSHDCCDDCYVLFDIMCYLILCAMCYCYVNLSVLCEERDELTDFVVLPHSS